MILRTRLVRFQWITTKHKTIVYIKYIKLIYENMTSEKVIIIFASFMKMEKLQVLEWHRVSELWQTFYFWVKYFSAQIRKQRISKEIIAVSHKHSFCWTKVSSFWKISSLNLCIHREIEILVCVWSFQSHSVWCCNIPLISVELLPLACAVSGISQGEKGLHALKCVFFHSPNHLSSNNEGKLEGLWVAFHLPELQNVATRCRMSVVLRYCCSVPFLICCYMYWNEKYGFNSIK